MNIAAWFKSLFADSLTSLRAAEPQLVELYTALDEIATRLNRGETDGVQEITAFFQAVSAFQDADLLSGLIADLSQHERYAPLVRQLDEFAVHVEQAGRDEYGMNRTEPGQPVSDNDIYLGDYAGYWTKTVAYIMGRRHEDAYYEAMCRQATEFMRSHIKPMLRILRNLRVELLSKAA